MKERSGVLGVLASCALLVACQSTVSLSPASQSFGPTPTPSATETATSTPSPVPTPLAATSYLTWTRIALPSPVSKAPGGVSADGVVQFKGSYIAIGEEDYGCCANGRSYLNKGLTWTSTDGRHWQLQHIASLDGAAILGLLTDGSHLYAYGDYAAVRDVSGGFGVGAVWVSIDGVSWTRSTQTDLTEGVLALGPHGLLAARSFSGTGQSQFLLSTDGLHWTPTSGHFPVDVMGMAVGSDGSALAIAWPNDSSYSAASTVAYRSADGVTWTGPQPISDQMLAFLVATPSGYLAMDNGDRNQLFRISGSASPQAVDLGVTDGFDVSNGILASGDVVIVRGASVAPVDAVSVAWISTDGGLTFGLLPEPIAAANADASLTGLVETPTGLLAVGKTGFVMAPGGLPLAWLIER
jgi:hypothetical protein